MSILSTRAERPAETTRAYDSASAPCVRHVRQVCRNSRSSGEKARACDARGEHGFPQPSKAIGTRRRGRPDNGRKGRDLAASPNRPKKPRGCSSKALIRSLECGKPVRPTKLATIRRVPPCASRKQAHLVKRPQYDQAARLHRRHGTDPKKRESWEFVRLSPITHTCPSAPCRGRPRRRPAGTTASRRRRAPRAARRPRTRARPRR